MLLVVSHIPNAARRISCPAPLLPSCSLPPPSLPPAHAHALLACCSCGSRRDGGFSLVHLSRGQYTTLWWCRRDNAHQRAAALLLPGRSQALRRDEVCVCVPLCCDPVMSFVHCVRVCFIHYSTCVCLCVHTRTPIMAVTPTDTTHAHTCITPLPHARPPHATGAERNGKRSFSRVTTRTPRYGHCLLIQLSLSLARSLAFFVPFDGILAPGCFYGQGVNKLSQLPTALCENHTPPATAPRFSHAILKLFRASLRTRTALGL